MSKLTLSIDPDVVQRAKDHARSRGISVSRLVEAFLRALPLRRATVATGTPILRRLRGALRGVDAESHREHLREKYG